MIRCQNCGAEFGEGRGFCPNCGQPAAAGPETPAPPDAPRAVPMSSFGQKREEPDKSRRVIYGAIALLAVLLLGGLAYLARQPSARPGEERLEGAVRPGSPDFPAGDKLIVEFDPNENAEIGPTALGPWAVKFLPVVRNFTGRTVSGLEFQVSGVDIKGQTIRQRTVVNRAEVEPNKILVPPLSINFPQDNRPADLKLQLTGVRFK